MIDKVSIADLKMYEEELRKHMSQLAKTLFLAEVMATGDDEFQQVVAEKWDDITAPIDVAEGGGKNERNRTIQCDNTRHGRIQQARL